MMIKKTLMLACLAVISLGAANAMADGTGIATPDYWAQQYRIEASKSVANKSQGATSGAVQFGTSDIAHPAFHVDTNLTQGGF